MPSNYTPCSIYDNLVSTYSSNLLTPKYPKVQGSVWCFLIILCSSHTRDFVWPPTDARCVICLTHPSLSFQECAPRPHLLWNPHQLPSPSGRMCSHVPPVPKCLGNYVYYNTYSVKLLSACSFSEQQLYGKIISSLLCTLCLT